MGKQKKRNWDGSQWFPFNFSVAIWHCLCYIFKSDDLRHSMPEQLHVSCRKAKQEMQLLYEMFRCLKKNKKKKTSFICDLHSLSNSYFTEEEQEMMPPPVLSSLFSHLPHSVGSDADQTAVTLSTATLFCDDRERLGKPLRRHLITYWSALREVKLCVVEKSNLRRLLDRLWTICGDSDKEGLKGSFWFNVTWVLPL